VALLWIPCADAGRSRSGSRVMYWLVFNDDVMLMSFWRHTCALSNVSFLLAGSGGWQAGID
jgi:hypothetical protein